MSLDLLLMQVHRDDVREAGLDEHLCEQLARDGAAAVALACNGEKDALKLALTASMMYWMRKGEARRLSILQSKNPRLSLECRSTVMM